jgi:RES domain-containing protein
VTSLPAPLGGNDLVARRLDHARYAATWDSGEGSYLAGGRWNSKGIRAVYCSLDPATAILEVAVHKGFNALDAVPHVLTTIHIADVASVFVVKPEDVPIPNWLRPGIPGAAQQAYGDSLMTAHRFVVIPSALSPASWNVIFVAASAKGGYVVRSQDRFALDTRLNPPTTR